MASGIRRRRRFESIVRDGSTAVGARMTYDLLVLGAGIAGCTSAIRAADLGARVLLVSKDVMGESNTGYAQGGIIGLPPEGNGDSPELLASDIDAAGAGLC